MLGLKLSHVSKRGSRKSVYNEILSNLLREGDSFRKDFLELFLRAADITNSDATSGMSRSTIYLNILGVP